jgi:hypothetical protein
MSRIAAAAAALLFGVTPAFAADWITHGVNDHLTGKSGPGAAVDGVIEQDGRKQRGQLWAYCSTNSTTVNISAEYIYFGSSNVAFRYTLDGGAPATAYWNYCQGGKCIGLWNGQGIPFLKSLFDKREMRAVIDRLHLAPLYATFHVDGARGALVEVGETCGWLPKEAPKGK